MEYITIIVALALWQYTFFSFKVGAARGKYGVKVPAVSGNPEWEKLYRIQCNTLEQLIVFIPSIYAFSFFLSPTWAAVLGVIYLIGRIIFYVGYLSEKPVKRAPGFALVFFSNQILIAGSVYGAISKLL